MDLPSDSDSGEHKKAKGSWKEPPANEIMSLAFDQSMINERNYNSEQAQRESVRSKRSPKLFNKVINVEEIVENSNSTNKLVRDLAKQVIKLQKENQLLAKQMIVMQNTLTNSSAYHSSGMQSQGSERSIVRLSYNSQQVVGREVAGSESGYRKERKKRTPASLIPNYI